MNNILVTNAFDSGDDVMIFTEKFTTEQVEQQLREKNVHFDDVVEVRNNELEYYIYEPCWV